MQSNIALEDVVQWFDKLSSDLLLQEDSFGEYLARKGRVHELKEEVVKLDEMRQGK